MFTYLKEIFSFSIMKFYLYCKSDRTLKKVWILITMLLLVCLIKVYKHMKEVEGLYKNCSCNHYDKYYVHGRKDLNFTKFDISKIKLHFLPGVKNPCILERDTEATCNVYKNNKFITMYYSRTMLRRKMVHYSRYNPHGNFITINSTRNDGIAPGRYRLRCLPYFMLLGVAKSGTSDFFFRIKMHPDVYPSINKELFFWSQFRFQINATLADYMDLFDQSVLNYLKDLGKDKKMEDMYKELTRRNFVLSEYTSVEFMDNVFWKEHPGNKGLMEPKYVNAHDLYAVNPGVKLIVLLRNPTTRLYSSYNMFRRISPEDFHAGVVASIEWWKNCTEKLGLPRRRCVYGCPPEMPPPVCVLAYKDANNRWPGAFGNYSGEIRRGMYAIFAKDWLSVFPKKQILFLRTEDNTTMTVTFNTKVLPFLGLREARGSALENMSKQKHSHQSKPHKPMLQKTKILLDKFYEPFNKELAKLLNDDKWLWKD